MFFKHISVCFFQSELNFLNARPNSLIETIQCAADRSVTTFFKNQFFSKLCFFYLSMIDQTSEVYFKIGVYGVKRIGYPLQRIGYPLQITFFIIITICVYIYIIS